MQRPCRLRPGGLAWAVLAFAAHTGCFLPIADSSSYYLAAPLVPVGAGAQSGRVEILFTARERTFFVEVDGLAPGVEYTVMLDGSPFALITTDSTGRAAEHLDLGAPVRDPRGRRIAVTDASGAELLELAAASNARYFEAEVVPLASFGLGAGQVQTSTIAGQRAFVTRLVGAQPGSYDVVVDGTRVATLDAPDGSGNAVVPNPGFDPRTAAIEVQLDGIGYFAGSGQAMIEGIDWCSAHQEAQALTASAAGTGVAVLATYADCSQSLEVRIEGVPMDLYELRIAGAVRAMIAVGADESGATLGSARFAPGEAGTAPLDFEPIGAPIEVLRAGEVWFAVAAFQP